MKSQDEERCSTIKAKTLIHQLLPKCMAQMVLLAAVVAPLALAACCI
jgi:cytochrome c oxidase assembly factor CtaG